VLCPGYSRNNINLEDNRRFVTPAKAHARRLKAAMISAGRASAPANTGATYKIPVGAEADPTLWAYFTKPKALKKFNLANTK